MKFSLEYNLPIGRSCTQGLVWLVLIMSMKGPKKLGPSYKALCHLAFRFCVIQLDLFDKVSLHCPDTNGEFATTACCYNTGPISRYLLKSMKQAKWLGK